MWEGDLLAAEAAKQLASHTESHLYQDSNNIKHQCFHQSIPSKVLEERDPPVHSEAPRRLELTQQLPFPQEIHPN